MTYPKSSISLLSLLIVLLVAGLNSWGYATLLNNWKQEKKQKGVTVSTRKVDGYTLKEFKCITKVKASTADILLILKDVANYSKWQNVSTCKTLKKVSEEEFIYYTITDAPWPVSDRDNVSRSTINHKKNGEVLINMEALPDYIPEKSGFVRVPSFKGFWKLVPQTDNSTLIVHQGLASAGGNIPDWLANTSVVDTPFDALVKLRKMLGE